MNLSKVHHIAIIVSDYEAAREFYEAKEKMKKAFGKSF